MILFESPNYKDFLKAHIQNLPKKGRGEISRIAHTLRVNPTLISQILHGEKNLTLEQACDLASYLGLNALETAHFIDLVQHERAGTAKLKNFYVERLKENRKSALKLEKRIPRDHLLSESEKAIFYSSWIYSAIRLFTSIGDGKRAEEISEYFDLPRSETRKKLEFLTRTGLCMEKNGLFRMGPQRTHLEAESPFIHRHHLNWRLEVMKRAEKVKTDELLFTAPISLSRKDFQSIREKIVALIQEVSQTVKTTEAETLALLTLDWIRL